MIDIEHIVTKFGSTPLSQLATSEAFAKALTGTGENKSKFLVRRFSFRQPRLNIRVDNPAIVNIDMVYGLNNRTTVLTVERDIIANEKDKPFSIYVKNQEDTLASLEEPLSTVIGVKGWRFLKELRERTIESFLTEDSPYSFDLRIAIDNLSTYGDVYVSVIMDYIDIADAIKLMRKANPEMSREFDVCYNLKEKNVSPLALQYRDYVNNNPHIQSGHNDW